MRQQLYTSIGFYRWPANPVKNVRAHKHTHFHMRIQHGEAHFPLPYANLLTYPALSTQFLSSLRADQNCYAKLVLVPETQTLGLCPLRLLNDPCLPSSTSEAAHRWNNNYSHIEVTCHISNNINPAGGEWSDIGILIKKKERTPPPIPTPPRLTSSCWSKKHPLTAVVENYSFKISPHCIRLHVLYKPGFLCFFSVII